MVQYEQNVLVHQFHAYILLVLNVKVQGFIWVVLGNDVTVVLILGLMGFLFLGGELLVSVNNNPPDKTYSGGCKVCTKSSSEYYHIKLISSKGSVLSNGWLCSKHNTTEKIFQDILVNDAVLSARDYKGSTGAGVRDEYNVSARRCKYCSDIKCSHGFTKAQAHCSHGMTSEHEWHVKMYHLNFNLNI